MTTGAVIALLLAVIVLWVFMRPGPEPHCAQCGGTVNVDAECGHCLEPLHHECWSLHLCKYLIHNQKEG